MAGEVGGQVVSVSSQEPRWEELRSGLPGNSDILKELWVPKNENRSIMLNVIDQMVLEPVGKDMAERFAGKKIGISLQLVTKSGEAVAVGSGDRVATALPIGDLAVIDAAARVDYINPMGDAAELAGNDKPMSIFGPSLLEGVGTMASLVVHSEGVSLLNEKPAMVVYDLADKDNPIFLGAYPLDMDALAPMPVEKQSSK